jgi:hypothetical protein
MPEGGNLSSFDALGKLRELSLGGGVWTEGVAGEMGVAGPGGVGGVGAAGEETGDEASEAQGGYLKEIAFGA